ncbi:hypothetical protein [Mucilaginibacter sp. HD30]
MTTHEKRRSDKEEQKQSVDLGSGEAGGQSKTNDQDNAINNESDYQEQIAEKQRKMAQAGVGFSGD